MWLVAGIFVAFQFFIQSSPSVMITPLMADLNLSLSGIGWLSSSFFITYVILQIPAGLLVDRFGIRRVLCGSVALFTLTTLGFAATPWAWAAFLSRALMGLAAASCVIGAMSVAAKYLPRSQFALFSGFTEMLGMLGGGLGESTLAWCVNHCGWRTTMFICTGIAAAIWLLCWWFLRPNTTVLEPSDKPTTLHDIWQQLACLLKQSQIWWITLYSGCQFALISGFASLWCIPYLQSNFHIDLQNAATSSAMIFLGAVFGTPCIGFIAGRSGHYRFLMVFFAALTYLLFLFSVLVPPQAINLERLLLVALGFCASSYILPFAMIKHITPKKCLGAALGLTNMMCIIPGSAILQGLIGTLLSMLQGSNVPASACSVENFKLVLLPLMVCSLLGLFFSLLIKPMDQQADGE